MLSIIIPSRNIPSWPFLKKTVDGLFENATGEIEVIVILDGYMPDPPLKERDNLTIIYHSESKGMRNGINEAVAVAKGKFICKCDDHCAFSKGFDEILAADCEDNWLVVPARYSLDGEAWLAGSDKIRKYGPIHHLYLTYPYRCDSQFGHGMHGKKWMGEHGVTGGYFDREKQRKDILIDDVLSIQGSCWFMTREHYYNIGGMQVEGFSDWQEAQELTFKTFLSGGRCVVNKKTYYCHLHKGKDHGRGYHIFRHHKIQSEIYSTKYWMNNQWPGQIKKLKAYIEHPNWFPLEGWPDDWDDEQFIKNYDYSLWLKR